MKNEMASLTERHRFSETGVECASTKHDTQYNDESLIKKHASVNFKRAASQRQSKEPPEVFDMIKSGMSKKFTLTNPEHGIKGYNMPEQRLQDHAYKIRKLAPVSQDRFKTGFNYKMIKAHGQTPCCMDLPLLVPWTTDKYYKHSGDTGKFRFRREKKILMTEKVMLDAKKEDVPGAKYKYKT